MKPFFLSFRLAILLLFLLKSFSLHSQIIPLKDYKESVKKQGVKQADSLKNIVKQRVNSLNPNTLLKKEKSVFKNRINQSLNMGRDLIKNDTSQFKKSIHSKPFKINPGEASLTQFFANRDGAYPVQSPATYTRFTFSGSVSIKGLPITVNTLLSTEQQTLIRQPMNRVQIGLDMQMIQKQLNQRIDGHIHTIQKSANIGDLNPLDELYSFYDKNKLSPDETTIKKYASSILKSDSIQKSLKQYDIKNEMDAERVLNKISSSWKIKDSTSLKFIKRLKKTEGLKNRVSKLNIKDWKNLSLKSAQDSIEKGRRVLDKTKKKKKSKKVKKENNKIEKIQDNINVERLSKLERMRDSIMRLDPKRLSEYEENIAFKLVKNKSLKEKYALMKKYGYMTPQDIVASKIKGFSIGTSYPAYSKYTMWNMSMTGVSAELQPFGKIYVAFVTSQNLNAIPSKRIYSRKITAAKIGIGDKTESHLHFTILSGSDNRSSVFTDSASRHAVYNDFYLQPRQNKIVGSDFKIKINQKWDISGEIAHSTTSLNTDSGMVSWQQIKIFSKEKYVRDSTKLISGNAFNLSTQFKLASNTNLVLKAERIGPGYYSLGSPYLRNDLEGGEIKIERKMMGGKAIIAPSYGYLYDNLLGNKKVTTFMKLYGIQLRLNFSHLPYVIMDYTLQEMQNQRDNIYNTNILNFTSGYNYKLLGSQLQSSLSTQISTNSNKNPEQQALVRDIKRYLFNQSVLFSIPIQISVSYSFSDRNDDKGYATQTSLAATGSYNYLGFWKNSFGFSLVKDTKMGNKQSSFFETSFNFKKNISIKARFERNVYKTDIINLNYSESVAALGIQFKF